MNKLSPFKWFVLQNFPFIEADFDALTNYELMCKIVEYLNLTIAKTNELGEQVEILTNWFDNLDVQDEIDNKLDEMAESGELTEIIAQYLSLAGCFAFKTLADMKNADNLVENSICLTFGKDTYNDGKGEHYIIRQITSGDVVDNDKIVAVNFSNTLIAEKQENNRLNLLESADTIMIGDSYGEGLTLNSDSQYENITSWCDILAELLELESGHYYKFVKGGTGFHARNSDTNQNFLDLLRDNSANVTNKNLIKRIVVCGGYNDNGFLLSPLRDDIEEFCTYAKSQYPNATIYIGLIGSNYGALTELGNQVRANLLNNVYLAYSDCQEFGAIYLNGVENIMHDATNFSTDLVHPNQNGYNKLGQGIYQAIKTGKYSYNTTIRRGYLENSSNYNLTDDTVYNNNNVVTQMLDEIENVILPDMKFNFATNVTVNTRGTFGIGIIHNDLIQVADTSFRIPVIIEVTATNTNTYKFYGNLRINQLNALYIEFVGKTGYTQPDTTTITTTKLAVKGGERIMPTKFM